MKFCFGFFILLWLFVGVAKTLQPESKTTNTKNNKCSSNSNDTSLEECRECEYKKAEHIRRKIEKKYRWLPRSNFYRQLYIVKDSTRKMIYCNSGTIYSDQTSPPDIQVDHFLRYDYYGYKADNHFDDECYATVVYTEKNMDANSKFIVHFSAKKSTEGSNDAKDKFYPLLSVEAKDMVKKDILEAEQYYRWLPRSNFYRKQYIVQGSTRNTIYCNYGVIYSDEPSGPPRIEKREFARATYYSTYDNNLFYQDECYVTITYVAQHLNNSSNFLLYFGAESVNKDTDDNIVKDTWKNKWGSAENNTIVKIRCHPQHTNKFTEACNSIDFLLGDAYNLQIMNWENFDDRIVTDGTHYTVFDRNDLIVRRFLWNLVYPEWPDIDSDCYESILQKKDLFSNVSQTIKTSDEVFTIPNRLLLSEDTIDEKLGSIGTIAVICIVCLYVIMFRLAYQWIIKGNQMEEAHNIA